MLPCTAQDLIETSALSGLQLESIVYACQRHEQFLPDGSRCAFFLGDGEPRLIVALFFARVGCLMGLC
jgi:hypothetical protein